MFALLALATCLLVAPRATAQRATNTCPGSRDYRGQCVAVPVVTREPSPYSECAKVRGTSQAEVYACFLAVTEAKDMASLYGGGHGRLFGFDRGFAAGMHDAADRMSHDNRFIDQGVRIADGMGAFTEGALRDVSARGEAQGTQDGAALARERFDRAVGNGQSGQSPSKTIGAIQPPNYQGEDDSYTRLVPQDGEYATLDPRQILERMDREYRRYNTAYDHIDARSGSYMGDYTRLSLRDLWFDDGVYAFDARHWMDPAVALRAWLTQPGIARARYDTLNRHAPEDIERNASTGDPVLGPDGKTICRHTVKDPASSTITRCATIDLQGVFQRSFADAYAYHVGYAFSSMLNAGLDDGYRQGIVVGTELGRRMALSHGMVLGFNETFRTRSRTAFVFAYELAYSASFDTEFEAHATRPVLSVELIDVVGSVADGVLEPGESFALRYRIVNSGGVPSSLTGVISGGVDNARPVQDSIGALMRREYTTGIVGRVDPRLRAGQRADIRLTINGAAAQSISTVVRRAIQLAPSLMAIDAPNGSGTVTVSVRNVSTVRTAGEVVATFSVDGREVSRSVGTLEPGEARSTPFEFASQDPMLLIFSGARATVRARIGDVLMDEQEVRLLSSSPNQSLVRYFGSLVQPGGEGGYIPAGPERDRRLADVAARIVSLNEAETRGARANLWKDTPQATLAGMVRDEVLAMPRGVQGTARFHELGERMWASRTNFGKFLFIKSGKRKAYERLIQEIIRRSTSS
jgi:hypothetical protein